MLNPSSHSLLGSHAGAQSNTRSQDEVLQELAQMEPCCAFKHPKPEPKYPKFLGFQIHKLCIRLVRTQNVPESNEFLGQTQNAILGESINLSIYLSIYLSISISISISIHISIHTNISIDMFPIFSVNSTVFPCFPVSSPRLSSTAWGFDLRSSDGIAGVGPNSWMVSWKNRMS